MSEMPRQRGLLFCLSGPSGVGKGTVIDEVRRRRPQVAHSVSITTRPPRPGEIEGVTIISGHRNNFTSCWSKEKSWNMTTTAAITTERRAPRSKPCAMKGATS